MFSTLQMHHTLLWNFDTSVNTNRTLIAVVVLRILLQTKQNYSPFMFFCKHSVFAQTPFMVEPFNCMRAQTFGKKIPNAHVLFLTLYPIPLPVPCLSGKRKT